MLMVYTLPPCSQTIPYDDLKRLGIPPPPEGRYMSHYEVLFLVTFCMSLVDMHD
jgi:hypothetical protein